MPVLPALSYNQTIFLEPTIKHHLPSNLSYLKIVYFSMKSIHVSVIYALNLSWPVGSN